MSYKIFSFLAVTLVNFVIISATSIELKCDEAIGQLKVNCKSPSTDVSKLLDKGNYSGGVSCKSEKGTEVLLSGCSMATIPQEFFRKVRHSKAIEIKSPGAESINPGDFGNNNNLEKLLMKENRLRELPSNLFMYTPNIEEIDLSHNQIIKIDPDTFVDGVEKLKKIDLTNNRIKSLDANLFASLVQLEYLDMDKNSLEQLNCNAFPYESVVNHTVLSFEWNELQKVDLNCATNRSNTKSLFINNNRIKKLSLLNSEFVQSLTCITAYVNNITEISIESDLINLKYLSLSTNCLTNISDVFERCSSLDFLGFSHNNLRQLPAHAFDKMTKLDSLSFENISLSELAPETFSHVRNLSFLDFAHNKLKKINFEWFLPSFDRLEGLFINDNQLKELTGWSNSIFPHLKVLGIGDNPFNCSYLKSFLPTIASSQIQLIPSSTQTENSVKGINCENIS